MKLPEVAARLRELAVELNHDELNRLADEIRRRRGGPPAPDVSQSMTDEIREQIKSLKAANPHLSHAEIGRRLNITSSPEASGLRDLRGGVG